MPDRGLGRKKRLPPYGVRCLRSALGRKSRASATRDSSLRSGTYDNLSHIDISRLLDCERNGASDRRRVVSAANPQPTRQVSDLACTFSIAEYILSYIRPSDLMAKPKSEDKRNAILAAAAQVFAERGLGAPTAAITKAAGIAEGSLFTYFKTKDDLINALYRELKLELADSMMSGFPRKQSVRHRLEHAWNGYVHWGVANPDQQKVLKQIQVWGGLTQESKQAGSTPFTEFQKMTEDAVTQKIYKDMPQALIGATLIALAEMTMDFMAREPKRAEMYRSGGFEMLWAALTRR